MTVEAQHIEYLQQLVRCLTSGSDFPQDWADESNTDLLSAVYLASTRYESELDKKRFVELSERCLSIVQATQNVEIYDQAEQIFEQELETDSIAVVLNQSEADQVREASRAYRFALPQIEEIITREAKRVVQRLREALGSFPFTVNDIKNELYVYLFDNLERNYKPDKSPYSSYVSMSIGLRGKRLVSLYLKKFYRENVISVPESTDFESAEEYVEYLLASKSEADQSIATVEKREFAKRLTEKLKSYEKGVVLLRLYNVFEIPLLKTSQERHISERLKHVTSEMLGDDNERIHQS